MSGETVQDPHPHGIIPQALPFLPVKFKRWLHLRRESDISNGNPERHTSPTSPGRQRRQLAEASQASPPEPTPVDSRPKKRSWFSSRLTRSIHSHSLTPPHPHPYTVPPWEIEELYPYQYPISPAYSSTWISYKYSRLLETPPSENTTDPEAPYYHPPGPGIHPVEKSSPSSPRLSGSSESPSVSPPVIPVFHARNLSPETSNDRSQLHLTPVWVSAIKPKAMPESEDIVHFALGTPRRRSWLRGNDAPQIPQARHPPQYTLLPELIPKVINYYPGVDWVVICPIDSAFQWVEEGSKSQLDLAEAAITPHMVGEVEIRSYTKDSEVAYIIDLFGPLRVVTSTKEFMTVGHVLQAIKDYFCTAVDQDSFTHLDDRIRSMVNQHYQFRRENQGKNLNGIVYPLFDHEKPIRADLMHGVIKYAGLEMDVEFSHNHTLYLSLENVRMQVGY